MFDSGIGGLSVLEECRRLLPHESFIYESDKEHFPYGNKSVSFIKKRVFHLSEKLLYEHNCKAIVVACNTGATIMRVLESGKSALLWGEINYICVLCNVINLSNIL